MCSGRLGCLGANAPWTRGSGPAGPRSGLTHTLAGHPPPPPPASRLRPPVAGLWHHQHPLRPWPRPRPPLFPHPSAACGPRPRGRRRLPAIPGPAEAAAAVGNPRTLPREERARNSRGDTECGVRTLLINNYRYKNLSLSRSVMRRRVDRSSFWRSWVTKRDRTRRA